MNIIAKSFKSSYNFVVIPLSLIRNSVFYHRCCKVKIIIKNRLHLTGMHKVMRVIGSIWGIEKFENALELFGNDGSFHIKDYLHKVINLDVWEIRESCKKQLEKNLPGANITIADTYKQLITVNKKYDLVVCDNPSGMYGISVNAGEPYCEHFNVFPEVFNFLEKKSILILSVIPGMKKKLALFYPDFFNEDYLAARRRFYHTSNPENISLKKMMLTYKELAKQSGFEIVDYCYVNRHHVIPVHYLVFRLVSSGNPYDR